LKARSEKPVNVSEFPTAAKWGEVKVTVQENAVKVLEPRACDLLMRYVLPVKPLPERSPVMEVPAAILVADNDWPITSKGDGSLSSVSVVPEVDAVNEFPILIDVGVAEKESESAETGLTVAPADEASAKEVAYVKTDPDVTEATVTTSLSALFVVPDICTTRPAGAKYALVPPVSSAEDVQPRALTVTVATV
jgi:hypothetical protein